MNTYKVKTSKQDDGQWIAELDVDSDVALRGILSYGDTEEQAICNVLGLYFTMRELS